MLTVRSNMTDAQVREMVGRFAGAVAGRVARWDDLVRGIKLRMATTLLAIIRADFVTKARGGTGSDGIRWQPLKRSTIAQRPISPGDRKEFGIKGKRERGLLTPAENKRWRHIFATRKAWLEAKFGLSDADASARAAQIAWATLKGEGAQTKLEVLGGRPVEILRDTGLLLQSLSPGVPDSDQVMKTPSGALVVGTNQKPWHHRGIPGRLPARPFWPDGKANPFPRGYLTPVIEAGRRGVLEAIALIARFNVQGGGVA